jgi:hypothetical protein
VKKTPKKSVKKIRDSRHIKMSPLPIHSLSGCNFFSYYPNVNGRKILLLGESHTMKNMCDASKNATYVWDWIKDIAMNSNECTDILLEQDYTVENETDTWVDTPLGYTRKVLYNLKSDVTRYHRSDLRSFFEKTTIESIFVQMYNEDMNMSMKAESLLNPMVFSIILDYMLMIDTSVSAKKIYESFCNNLYTSIYKKSVPSELKRIFNIHDTIYIKKVKKELSKMDSSIDKKRVLQTLKSIYMTLTDRYNIDILMLIPMDLYVLTRMFISFDSKKMKRGPFLCESYKTMKNIIFFGGSLHSRIYNQFIKEYFGITPSIYRYDVDSKCTLFEKPFLF